MTRNGNKFVKAQHVFVPGDGCYFESLAKAVEMGTSPNGVGLWTKTIEFDGATWYMAGNENVWN